MIFDTYLNIKMDKYCRSCKKTLTVDTFIFDGRSKPYSICNNCRLKCVPKKNHCKVCGVQALYNFEGKNYGSYCSVHKLPNMIDVKNKKCIFKGCKTQPTFNFKGGKGLYCRVHKLLDMIDVKHKSCIHPGCKIRPGFNYKNTTKGLYCKDHKLLGMIDVENINCFFQGCKTQPNFNFEGEKDGIYCAIHKRKGMVNVTYKTCFYTENGGCKKQPVYNYESEKEGIYCVSHKFLDMVDVINKRCIFKECKTQPSFNFEGKTELYCTIHKLIGMINVKNNKCIFESCVATQPSFNFKDQLSGIYCNVHKLPGMINVKSKRCIFEGCETQSMFNFEGKTSGIYCKDHKLFGMIDVKNKKCIFNGCKTQPKYNYKDKPDGIYCDMHKLFGMIDVINKNCIQTGCNTRSNYNFPGMYPDFCSRHKTNGMIINPRKKCCEELCDSLAMYGLYTHVHCEEHKQVGEYNLVERKCLNPNCANKFIDILDVNGFCVSYCSMIEQSKLYRKYQKKKEIVIKNLLEKHIVLPLYMEDITGDNGCSTSKPDFVYHLGTHILIIEVDEKQHKSYTNCGQTKDEIIDRENRRMYNLAHEFDGLPVIYLRYNPDTYRVDGKLTKTPDKQRHDIFIKWVKKCISESIPEGIHVKYLFFDQYEETDLSFNKLTEDDFSMDDFI